MLAAEEGGEFEYVHKRDDTEPVAEPSVETTPLKTHVDREHVGQVLN